MATLENRISASINPVAKAAILAALGTIETNLPFLINLNPGDRHAKRKTGTKREGYVVAVYDASTAHSSAIPSSFDMTEWDKDEALNTVLKQIFSAILSVTESIDDTLLQIGFERIKQADLAYSYLQTAAQGNSALTTIVDQIGAQFLGQGRTTAVPVTTIPASGSVTVNNAVVNTNLINEGDTVLKVTMNAVDTMVRPGDVVKVTNKVVLVVNVSTTTAGQFSVKTK